jgi:hypothetical protein
MVDTGCCLSFHPINISTRPSPNTMRIFLKSVTLRQAQQRLQKGNGSSRDQHLTRFTISEILSDVELRKRIGILLLMSIPTVVGWLTYRLAEELPCASFP